MTEFDRDRTVEYVLGLLAGGEQTTFAQTVEADPRIAGEVAWWDGARLTAADEPPRRRICSSAFSRDRGGRALARHRLLRAAEGA